MPNPFARGLRFRDSRDSVRDAIAGLDRAGRIDIAVVVSHVGFPQDVALARDVDGIDVVLSGHTHDRLLTPARVGRTWIIQSGFSGSFLGRLDLEVADQRVRGVRHQLIALTDSLPEAADVEAIVREQMRPFRDQLDDVAGQTATALHRMQVLDAPMDRLITDAYRDLTGADVAFSHGWRYGVPIPAGPVTIGDLWQMVPTDPEIVTLDMTGGQIRGLLERNLESVFSANPLEQRGGHVIRVSGLAAVVRVNNAAGHRIQQLQIGARDIGHDARYTVAVAGEQDIRGGERRTHTGVRAIEALRRYLGRHSPVALDMTTRRSSRYDLRMAALMALRRPRCLSPCASRSDGFYGSPSATNSAGCSWPPMAKTMYCLPLCW